MKYALSYDLRMEPFIFEWDGEEYVECGVYQTFNTKEEAESAESAAWEEVYKNRGEA